MKYYLIVALFTLICAFDCSAKGNKSDRKIKSAIDKEELRFKKDQGKDPYNAEIYWEHANNVAAFSSEYPRALYFYKKALAIDSINAAIYKDYGRYLFTQLHAIDDAKSIITKGLLYAPKDEEMNKDLNAVNEAIARRDEEVKLRDFGTSSVKELNPNGNYSNMANFDSLKKILSVYGGNESYQKLMNRYLADDVSLTPAEMYLLIIGYTMGTDYNPFDYNEILAMKQMAAYNIDSAINRGIGLINTNPLNPTLNRELMYYYRKKNDMVTADKYKNRVQQFFNGMLYSGNGTCSKPYISLWSKEQNNFVCYLGYKPTDNHSMTTCAGQMAEIMDVINPASGKTESIFFNLKLIYLQTTRK